MPPLIRLLPSLFVLLFLRGPRVHAHAARAAAPPLSSALHVLPSGRRVPLRAILSHPHTARASAAVAVANLFELSDRGILVDASNATLAVLRSDAAARSVALPLRAVLLNGRSVPSGEAQQPRVAHATDGGVEATFVGHDARPVAISLADGRHLAPLHFDHHPGVYIAHTADAQDGVVARAVGKAEEKISSAEKDPIEIALRKFKSKTAASSLPVSSKPASSSAVLRALAKDAAIAAAFDTGRTGKGESSRTFGSGTNPSSRTYFKRAVATENPTLPATTARQGGPSCGPLSRPRYYEVAALFDNTFCARYGNNFARAVAAIHSSLSRANQAYAPDVCLRLALVSVDARCRDPADPFAPLRGRPLRTVLQRVADILRNVAQSTLPRDVAVFFPGFVDRGTDFISLALDGGACTRARAYAVSERLAPRTVANTLAYTLGAPLQPARGPLRLNRAGARFVRRFLERSRQARCITRQRRRCVPLLCRGRCVRGACVTGFAAAPSRRPLARKCGQTFRRDRPLACVRSIFVNEFTTPWDDRLQVAIALVYDAIAIRIKVLSGAVGLQEAVRVGGATPRAFNNLTLRRRGQTQTTTVRVDNLATPRPGRSCCGQRLLIRVRISGCDGGGRCGTTFRTYQTRLGCVRVCNGRGTPVAMSSSTICPFCRR